MRRRVRDEEHAGELNIIPYLDIITNLVMFMMLSMAGLISLGVVNVTAPKINAEQQAQPADPNQPKLLLMVAISKRGFYIAGSGGVLGGPADGTSVDATQPPTVPVRPDGRFDYDSLTAQMVKIKDRYPQETSVILSADPDIPYDILIQTMDACREVKVQSAGGLSERRPLFFDVALSLIG